MKTKEHAHHQQQVPLSTLSSSSSSCSSSSSSFSTNSSSLETWVSHTSPASVRSVRSLQMTMLPRQPPMDNEGNNASSTNNYRSSRHHPSFQESGRTDRVGSTRRNVLAFLSSRQSPPPLSNAQDRTQDIFRCHRSTNNNNEAHTDDHHVRRCWNTVHRPQRGGPRTMKFTPSEQAETIEIHLTKATAREFVLEERQRRHHHQHHEQQPTLTSPPRRRQRRQQDMPSATHSGNQSLVVLTPSLEECQDFVSLTCGPPSKRAQHSPPPHHHSFLSSSCSTNSDMGICNSLFAPILPSLPFASRWMASTAASPPPPPQSLCVSQPYNNLSSSNAALEGWGPTSSQHQASHASALQA